MAPRSHGGPTQKSSQDSRSWSRYKNPCTCLGSSQSGSLNVVTGSEVQVSLPELAQSSQPMAGEN